MATAAPVPSTSLSPTQRAPVEHRAVARRRSAVSAGQGSALAMTVRSAGHHDRRRAGGAAHALGRDADVVGSSSASGARVARALASVSATAGRAGPRSAQRAHRLGELTAVTPTRTTHMMASCRASIWPASDRRRVISSS